MDPGLRRDDGKNVKILKSLALILLGMVLTVFLSVPLTGGPDLAYYKDEKPTLAPDDFFNGSLTSIGVFEDALGRAVERFRMDATASWDGDSGKMHERFLFADGRKAERHWTFRKTADGGFIGTAPDVIGEAKGEVSGNALHWVYTITLPVGGHDVSVTFDDWLYLIDETHMISRVRARKFGLPVGQMTMAFEKLPNPVTAPK